MSRYPDLDILRRLWSTRAMPRHPNDCPYCYANVRGRSNFKGHRGYRKGPTPWREGVYEMLKRQQRAEAAPGPVDLGQVHKDLAKYPDLCDFLFLSRWPEDGTPRETGTVLLFGDGPFLKCMLNDRSQALVAFLTIEPGKPLWKTLDEAVCSPGTDWRPAKKFEKRK